MKKILLMFLVTLQVYNCEDTTKSYNKDFYADAGENQTTIVGSYVFLDATKSKYTELNGISWFEWEQDKNNPAEILICNGSGMNVLYQPVSFKKVGTYKFYFTIIENDEKSNRDKITIKVKPREQVYFEDASLECYVRFILDKQIEPLYESDFLSLDSIVWWDLVTPKVESFEGIQKCINLKFLDMTLQNIQNLSPLSGLTKLERLEIDQNHELSDVTPLSNLTKLKYLNIEVNKISDISSLSGLVELEYLNLMFTEVSDISVVKNFNKLEYLWFSHSPIKNIESLKNLTYMKQLWLSACEISDISPLINMTEIRYLFLKHNQITDISALKNMTKAEQLLLSDNQIADISVLENLPNLKVIKLPNNNISDISPLVNNQGIGEGDFIILNDNPLNNKSIEEYIPILQSRGVDVFY